MTFRVLDALPILVERFGPTVNKVPSGPRKGLENQKVMGFRVGPSKVLALDVDHGRLKPVRIWIEPLVLPPIMGVIVCRSKKSADLLRPELKALAERKGTYLEIQTRAGLEELLLLYA